MTDSPHTIRIRLDAANPGQFFACCGLLELASRQTGIKSPPVLAWFDDSRTFVVKDSPPLMELIADIASADLKPTTPTDRPQTPLWLGSPFNLLLDWWRYGSRDTGKLKTWAGQMGVFDIALEMRRVMKLTCDAPGFTDEHLFETATTTNVREPFYFDAHRGLNANRRDVGFSVDALKKGSIHIKTACRPAVEFLSLVGLQRARPRPTLRERGKERAYDYCTWSSPIPVELLPVVTAGQLPGCLAASYRFTNPSRAEDYRAFLPATLRNNNI